MMARKLLTLGLVSVALVATACNTVAGAGKDVSSVGNATTKAADKSK
jgi:predicted small secreted protein